MKIAMLTDRLAAGGGCEYMFQIARGMPQHQFAVFAGKGSFPKLEALPNVRIVRKVPTAAAVEDEQSELICCQHLKPLLKLLCNPFSRPRIPVLMTVHGVHLRKYLFQPGIAGRIAFALRRRLEKYLYNRCSGLILLTPDDVDFVREWVGTLTPINIIPNGIADEHFGDPDPGLRRRLSEYSKCFMFVGRMEFQKGIDILLHAVALAQDALRDSRNVVCLVGDGGERQKMEQLTKKLGVTDLVIFTGALPGAAQLALADVVVAPSRFEGLPIFLLEAGMDSKCVVASDVSGNREIILDRETGLLFPSLNAGELAEILRNPPDRETAACYGENLRERVKRSFSLQEMLAKTAGLYARITGGIDR